MRNVIELRKGGTYFHVAFFDKILSIPSIETYIYEGVDEEDENQILFINAEGYLAAQVGLENVDTYYISYAKNELNTIVDKEHLICWLQEEHSPRMVATEYVYKFL